MQIGFKPNAVRKVCHTGIVEGGHRHKDAKEMEIREMGNEGERLCTETVEGTAGTLECVDDVECGDSLALGMFGVGDRVTDDLQGDERVKATTKGKDARLQGRP